MKLPGNYFVCHVATQHPACMRYMIAMLTAFCFIIPAGFANPSGSLPELNNAGIFRAAVVKIDITPDEPKMLLGYNARQSDGVHDRIYHRMVLLDDGFTKFVLVSTDICVISPSEYDHMASLLLQRFGIAPGNFWWSVTHTHSAPEVGVPGLPETFMGERYKHPVDSEYTSFVEQKILEGVQTAQNNLVKAKLGVGWGHSNANINRRAINVNGKASLGMDPDGPVDKRIGLIRIDKEDGTPLVLISNYAIHGTALGSPNLKISADVPGVVAEYVEEKTGVPMLFINGAAGNLAPVYSTYPNPQSARLSQFKVLLGDRIVAAHEQIVADMAEVKLFTGKIVVETARKEGLGWPSDLVNYTRSRLDGKNLVRLPVRFLKINHDIAVWSLPVELFCEISNEIRERSPYPYTFYYGYTNGWLGYLPTADQFKYGGYEVETVCPYTPEAERELKEAVMSYLTGDLRGKLLPGEQTVNRPTLVEAGEDGRIILTADQGKGIGPNIKYMPEWRAFGWFMGDDKVEWEISSSKNWTYTVIMEWSVDDDHAGQPFILESNADKITGRVGKSGSWETYVSASIGVLKIKAGKQKLTFKAGRNFDQKKALLDLRKIILVPVNERM
ncbi:neutral/alkaline non-lysosomal ceramidase N-terminal domain-containing protein [Agriterribacter sp.]|uniref:neutral/alkaline non-lysosomal ceramidase N-terminal domain-containing protein n=1 Tax=Agriterribacter sp. TaxID=2821509 RepID=UPI002C22BE9C|nr:neutral/alkaline non-lysosomal ceramidase N-terminal domain-containing protein [Agriterribacter sp.]HRP55762.1 neutral/alkaline non-lysosomal ceramidase N-terminal domain-containing protein [Agriterribacter sp.]